MPLLEFWAASPEAIGRLSIQQIVSSAGDGRLRDGSVCSSELRQYLSEIKLGKIAEYVDYCLTSGFPGSGHVLQDLVNELGRRLEYTVKNGWYQGRRNDVGFDGIWQAPEGHWLVVEVKTTDTYRIPLETVARYRSALINDASISSSSSILIVVGREDTGELEAQVRGSRHAWDIRLISTDALVKLSRLREETDDPETAQQIRSLLVPFEYTKVDAIIDVMFNTARDAERADANAPDESSQTAFSMGDSVDSGRVELDSKSIAEKRGEIVDALSRFKNVKFVRRSQATYWTADRRSRIVCTISKLYDGREKYWYAYHPKWDDFLSEHNTSWFVLGCLGLPIAFVIPVDVLRENLGNLNTTTRPDGQMYWHVKILEPSPGRFALHLPIVSSHFFLDEYAVSLGTSQ